MSQKTAGHPIEYKGVRYLSYTACGRAFALGWTVVKNRLAKGQPLELRHAGVLRKR